MLLVSFAYFLFLYIDIRLHVARIKYKGKVQSKPQQQQVTDYETSWEQVSINYHRSKRFFFLFLQQHFILISFYFDRMQVN